MNLGPGAPDPVLFLLEYSPSIRGHVHPDLFAEVRPKALITAE